MAVILVVEDDKNTRILTTARLKSRYRVLAAADGKEALDILYHEAVDLVVADIMMPQMDGYELVRTLREYNNAIPVILLTAKSAFEDKRRGFSTGTDDYMTKPVDYDELQWRIEALLRRAKISSSHRIEAGGAELDADSYTVARGDERIELPKKEFDLLYLLLSYPNVIFTKEQLLEKVWGFDTESDDSTVKTHINRLRSRFEGWDEFRIVTVRGLGYKGETR